MASLTFTVLLVPYKMSLTLLCNFLWTSHRCFVLSIRSLVRWHIIRRRWMPPLTFWWCKRCIPSVQLMPGHLFFFFVKQLHAHFNWGKHVVQWPALYYWKTATLVSWFSLADANYCSGVLEKVLVPFLGIIPGSFTFTRPLNLKKSLWSPHIWLLWSGCLSDKWHTDS